jgi:hypothetical protein
VFIIISVAWLASLPSGVLIAGGVGCALLLAFIARLAVGALIPASEREVAYTIAGPLISAFGATFALLMALSLANEASFLASANGIVSNEAADASRLAWASTSPGVDSALIQSALLGYLHATREYEWSGSNAEQGDDAPTANALTKLEIAVRTQAARPALGTPASSELLGALDAVNNDRRARLAAASHELPFLYLLILIVSGSALIVNASALTLRGGLRPVALVAGLAVVIGLSLALLFAIGTPWQGPIIVSGRPIDNVARDLSAGYFQR